MYTDETQEVTMYTEQNIRDMQQARETLDDHIRTIFFAIWDEDPSWRDHFRYRPEIDEHSIEGDTVKVRCTAAACGRGCCGQDYHTYTFPLSHLWEDRAVITEAIRQRVEAEKQAEQEEKEREEKKERERQERQERETFERLSAKYAMQKDL